LGERAVRILLKWIWVGLVVAVPAAAFGQTLPVTVEGNEARVTIELPGGIGAELTITFEDVEGLTPTSLDVTAELVSPLDLGILSRLPANVSIPGSFPVLVEIVPSASSLLTFSGKYDISLYTHNLELNPAVPMSFFKAPSNPPQSSFEDITVTEESGSYRAGGSGGDFSEFLIVVDNRPINTVINGKFNALQARLTQHSALIPGVVLNTLLALLNQASLLNNFGLTSAAIGVLQVFSQYVEALSGQFIPDVWQAHDPNTINVAGVLRSAADTLIFSLERKLSQ
jgi:hypothetical protein